MKIFEIRSYDWSKTCLYFLSLFLSTTDLDDNFEATQFIYHLESESDAVKNLAYRSTILLIAYPENEKKTYRIHFPIFKDNVLKKKMKFLLSIILF